MNTDDLIASLSDGVRPVGRHAVGLRLALGVIGGAVVSILLISVTLGFRPDLWLAMQGQAFWMKWGYTISMSAGAIYATARLARPDPGSLRRLWLIALPVLVLAALGLGELITTPRSEWLAMWLGHTWTKCPWLVLALAMPIFVGLLWSFRQMAPTRLRAAGAAAGLAAGAFAATVYCLHCPEVSAIFVLTWYSLGILLAASLGALVGPRLLRW
ncbi:DUF1109 domain-containing protein [Sphingomonas sp. UV9]|uniref:DUF1109 domain-containing protein n=1 Tax=Sphingomonas sp. UV9 TaxID=1851410 RepID=UPI000FFB5081|nr:DUF1109 domain-containing protein [Sphingomonas sp. UV9]RXD07419.1 DUF1109 domain-containing protein [Sphingomonas sp. UV9]